MNPAVPPGVLRDVIFIDDCPTRPIRCGAKVLEYFDAHLPFDRYAGQTTPTAMVQQNVVMEYPHERAVAEAPTSARRP